MKKFRLIGIIAVVLLAAMLLASCGASASLTKVLNKKYDISSDLYASKGKIAELDGFSFVKNTDELALFSDINDNGMMVQKLFSFAEGKVIATYTNSAQKLYDVELYDSIPAAFVLVEETIAQDPTAEDETVYKLLNVKGEEIATAPKDTFAAIEKVTDDLFIFDSVLYSVDKDNAITKKADIPEYLSVDSLNYAIDDYFYDIDYDDSVAVYDEDFKLLTYWELPGYAEGNISVLNNGDIFAQYTYELADDAEKYDYIEDGTKYDLTTVIVDAKTGKEKEIKADFVAISIMPNEKLYDEDADKADNVYTNKFENIAYIVRIENQRIDTDSYRNVDIVLFGNNGKPGASFRSFDEQGEGLPTKIGEDRYLVTLKTGDKYIINSKNKVIASISSGTLSRKAGFFVGEKAVYNTDLEAVYDLKANEATVHGSVGDTLFVKKELADDSYEIISLRGTEQKSVLTVTKDDNKEFFTVSKIGYGIKVTNDKGVTTYTYYNAAGTELLSAEIRLYGVMTSDDSCILYGMNGVINEYYFFSVEE